MKNEKSIVFMLLHVFGLFFKNKNENKKFIAIKSNFSLTRILIPLIPFFVHDVVIYLNFYFISIYIVGLRNILVG